MVEDGLDQEDALSKIEPKKNLDERQTKQQVYEEMKSNCINVEHLIKLLRFDRKSGQDHFMSQTQKVKGMDRSATS